MIFLLFLEKGAMTKVEPITNESIESEAPRKQHPAQP